MQLTEIEDAKLSEIEERIAKNESAALQYLDDFRTIRDERLYRDAFKTFAEYCQAKWSKSYRSINRAIEAQDVRKEISDANPDLGRTASQTSDRTLQSMKKIKPNRRHKVFEKASKAAGSKPVTPAIIRSVTAARDYSSAYSSPSKEQSPQPQPSNSHTTETSKPAPITDIPSAIAAIEACYERDKPWFNDLSTGKPRTPRAIFDYLIKSLQELDSQLP